MADALRIGSGDAVENIIRFCTAKVADWCRSSGNIRTIDDVERIVCERLQLVFEEIYSDADMHRVAKKYFELGEVIFATLPNLCDENTYATLIERRKVTARSHDRYVAVIDCRGDKASRRFFTKWHEIAHLLTLYNQLELPLHRSTSTKTPTERLMDVIAGSVGFYDEIFLPILGNEIEQHGCLSFAGVERVRADFCPAASFQSTLNACVARAKLPLALVEVGLGLTKSEDETLRTFQIMLIPSDPPKARVRVLSFIPNPIGNGVITMHRNMQVPSTSLLARLVADEFNFGDCESVEELGGWVHSSGKPLPPARVHIQARRAGDRVIGLLQLVTHD